MSTHRLACLLVTLFLLQTSSGARALTPSAGMPSYESEHSVQIRPRNSTQQSDGVEPIDGPIVNCWYAVSPDRLLRGYAYQGPTARNWIPPFNDRMPRTIEELAAALLVHYPNCVLRPYYDGNRSEESVRPLTESELQQLLRLTKIIRVERRQSAKL